MKSFVLAGFFFSLIVSPGLAGVSDQQLDEDFLAGQINTLFDVQSDGAVLLCVAVSTYNPLRERGLPLQRRLLGRAKFAIYDNLLTTDDTITGVVVANNYITTPKPRGSKWVSEYCVNKEKILKVRGEGDGERPHLMTGEKKRNWYYQEAEEHEGLLKLKPNDMVVLKELLDIYREVGDYGKVNQVIDTMILLKRK